MRALFCARCGGPLVTVVVSDRERPVCPACGHVVYSNPAPVAMVLARDADRRLLLVRRGVEPLKGFWALPSGYVETDESVEAAAVREVLEETGLEVAIDGLEGVFSAAGLGVVLVVYQATIVGGQLAPGSDAEDVRLADPREVPAIRVPPGGTELDHWFAGLLDQLISNADDPYPAAGGVYEAGDDMHPAGDDRYAAAGSRLSAEPVPCIDTRIDTRIDNYRVGV